MESYNFQSEEPMKSELEKPRTLILPPLPFFLAMLGGWWLDRNQWPLGLDVAEAGVYLGWLLVVAGFALFAWALWTMYLHHTTVNPYAAATELCTDGPFAYSRNPIYVGDFVLLLGVALILQTWWPLLFAPLIWAMIRFGVIRHEEAHLGLKFGQDYADYRARVRRWI